ncbi:MAG: FixH family protein [Chromatiales bacterium]|nr:FixH family protein [Gammaproteobacteria bacterium]MBW6477388.1 FixH family protein [Chromatiales bacterium]
MAISQSSNHAMRNPWVLGVLGFISLVVLVNAFFITMAITTSPGLVDENYYQSGRHFEQNIQQRREMINRLDWRMRIQVAEEIMMGRPTMVYLHVTDKAGLPLQDTRARLHAYRPSDADADFELEMRPFAPGIFSVETSFPLRGIWDLKVMAIQGEDNIETRHRISVKTN